MKNKTDSSERLEPSKITYVFLLFLYIISNVTIVLLSRLGGTVLVFGGEIPISAFIGVLSSISNVISIFLVLFFKKLGFITSLILLLSQFPLLVMNVFLRHNIANIPGIFTTTVTILAIIMIYRKSVQVDRYRQTEMELLKSQEMAMRQLFEQTATALVNAIDAKDTYSRGHSVRVAKYARMIARKKGMDEEMCTRVYYAGLLHDVGKIGIPNVIINKNGKLTDEEYSVIKEHPEKGHQILSGIHEYPYLCVGARYHHERYDGSGYPDLLEGERIPEIARIISVADSYDAMTSNRSYRDALPQDVVRQEIENGKGTQFDPEIADVMLQLMDEDPEYEMRETEKVSG